MTGRAVSLRGCVMWRKYDQGLEAFRSMYSDSKLTVDMGLKDFMGCDARSSL